MPRAPVDLSAHINQSFEAGHPADFPVGLQPVFQESDAGYRPVARRRAVVREDTGQVIAVVSDRYRLIPHREILDTVEAALAPLDVGPVPRGVYVDRQGARMRAVFKFPALALPVRQGDEICPCLKIQNSYDGTSRITVHIGAFRFVCTNLAVGGGGAFAGGFMSVHAGEIPLEAVASQLAAYLEGFEAIVALYAAWAGMPLEPEPVREILATLPDRARKALTGAVAAPEVRTVWDGYNAATHYATHETRSVRTAFDLLARVNRGFQEAFPVS